MMAGLQERLPEIRASAPHGEGCTSVAATDDVPIDVRVDFRNITKIDLDDAFFEADFDVTFS